MGLFDNFWAHVPWVSFLPFSCFLLSPVLMACALLMPSLLVFTHAFHAAYLLRGFPPTTHHYYDGIIVQTIPSCLCGFIVAHVVYPTVCRLAFVMILQSRTECVEQSSHSFRCPYICPHLIRQGSKMPRVGCAMWQG